MTALLAATALDPAMTEQAALEDVLDNLALPGGGDLSLLVLTPDAGSATAIAFYTAALATGPALASPAAFPWCLANAPAATIARRYGLTGPNITWLVGDLGEAAAYDPVPAWLDGATQGALIVAVRFDAANRRIAAWHWLPGQPAPDPVVLCDQWRGAAPG